MSAHLPTSEREAAVAEAKRMIQIVRDRGFKDGGARYTDAEIWQAIMDSRGWGGSYWDAAACKLLEHAVERRPVPFDERVAIAFSTQDVPDV